MIQRYLHIIFITLMMLVLPTQVMAEDDNFDWNRIIDAIIMVESGGNPKAYNKNGDCVGILQMRKVIVTETNNILKSNGSHERYTNVDRWDAEKSKEMFIILQEHFNAEHDIERIIKCWKYGFYRENYKTIGNDYYNRVMRHYRK